VQEPNTMDQLTEEARALFRAAQETHAERREAQTYTPGTHLPLEEAGRRTGINPDHLRYYDAIKEMEYEGAIEWDTSGRYARWDKHYVIIQRSLKMMLGRARGEAV
jgi:hypothetical protein